MELGTIQNYKKNADENMLGYNHHTDMQYI